MNNTLGIVAAVITTLGILGGGLAYVVNMSVNYGQLQQSVAAMASEMEDLNHQLADTSANLDGFQQFFMDFLASRNVTTGPLDLRTYQTSVHDHDGLGEHTHDD